MSAGLHATNLYLPNLLSSPFVSIFETVSYVAQVGLKFLIFLLLLPIVWEWVVADKPTWDPDVLGKRSIFEL